MAFNTQDSETEAIEFHNHIKKAVIRCLDPENSCSYAEIAYLYNVSPFTLRHQLNGQSSHAEAAVDQQLLFPLEKKLIVNYCEHFIAQGFPP